MNSYINTIDKSDMLSILLDFPNQCRIAKEIGLRFKPPKKRLKPNLILWCGIGGSAIGGDFIASYIKDKLKIPILINRHYNIPVFVNRDTFVVISSYSGNTEETISCYKQALAKGSSILVITSGGKLLEMAVKDGSMLIVIPQDLPPRCAIGYLSIPALIAFSKINLISLKISEIDETIALLKKLKEKLGPHSSAKTNISKNLANTLCFKLPLIYASVDRFEPVAYRWRTQIAENAKALSSHHLFAEMNHNEVEAFEPFSKLPKNIIVVMLKDKTDHAQIKKRMKITSDIIRKKGIKVVELNSLGKGVLSRMFSLIYIGDWMSFYLAILNGIDPTPVGRISYLKGRLAKE